MISRAVRPIGVTLVVVLGTFCCVATAGPASAAPNLTTTSLAFSPSTPVSGQAVTFTASVAETPAEGGTPSGEVRFEFPSPSDTCAGDVVVVPLVAGVATCTTTNLTAAQSSIWVTALYLGDPVDGASSSEQVPVPVSQDGTTLAVSSSAVHTPFNETGCTTTAGSTAVTCSSLSGVSVGAGVSDSDSAVSAGTSVTAVAHPTNSLTLSTAATTSQGGDTFTFLNDPTSALTPGHPVVFTATLAAAAPGSGAPTGTVTWTINGVDSSTVVCATGGTVNVNRTLVEQCKVPQGVLLASGSPYTVSAVYSGSKSYTGSADTFSQPVAGAATRTFVAGTRVPVESDVAESFTASVVPSKFGGTPTGSVTFTFTALPFKASGCSLSTTSSVVSCPTGSLSGVLAGYAVADVDTPGALAAGTTVVSVGSRGGSVTLSAMPTSTVAGQRLLFTPEGSGIPVVRCSGGDSLPYVMTGTTCSVPAPGFPSAGAIWGLIVTYPGDANNASSVSHQLTLRIQ